MPKFREEQLQDISKRFQIYGEILHAEPCKIGHINETYTATYAQGGIQVRYIHQKINRHVFLAPDEVMENLMRVTTHIRSRLENEDTSDLTRRVLIVVPTRDGDSYFVNPDGDFWRTFVFVEGVQSFESVESGKQAFEAGLAFGSFQSHLSDLPGDRLHETIPRFHHSRDRFASLLKAAEKDHVNRANNAKPQIDFCIENEAMVDVILQGLESGDIPERVTHNDTKFNNVMMDRKTGKSMCVVDLDTVMPGSVLYDFGDMIRTTTSPTLEDERDLSRVTMQMPTFQELAKGYLTTAGSFLTPKEKSLLAFSGKLIAFTIGLRFLTDYLEGDHYFRVHRPGHNLDRARTQFKLVQSIAEQEESMQRFVDQI
jgi:hypothetical protein